MSDPDPTPPPVPTAQQLTIENDHNVRNDAVQRHQSRHNDGQGAAHHQVGTQDTDIDNAQARLGRPVGRANA